MDTEDVQVTQDAKRSMSLASTVSLVFTFLVVMLISAMVIHWGVDAVYDYIEDKCIAGLCVDRQPGPP